MNSLESGRTYDSKAWSVSDALTTERESIIYERLRRNVPSIRRVWRKTSITTFARSENNSGTWQNPQVPMEERDEIR
jgi:hypothetical protein